MSWRIRLRRLRMGLSTLLGRPQGFFSPYRHADALGATEYPELAERFAAAEDAMVSLLNAADRLVNEVSGIGGPAPAPRWEQSWYPALDGVSALAMVAQMRPRRIVEVGSGHSTRFLTAAARHLEQEIEIACIDPAPRVRLMDLPVIWHREVLDATHLELFRALGPGDIAFFDSSHLLWPGSDVDIILNRILPALAPGVLVHVHDVFLPDPYPEDWAWRGYTEQLGLGGWLSRPDARILWSSRWIRTRMDTDRWPALDALPRPGGAPESALWFLLGVE